MTSSHVAPSTPCRFWADDALAAGDVILDFDGDGRLIGIEVLNASETLPAELLASAERIG